MKAPAKEGQDCLSFIPALHALLQDAPSRAQLVTEDARAGMGSHHSTDCNEGIENSIHHIAGTLRNAGKAL